MWSTSHNELRTQTTQLHTQTTREGTPNNNGVQRSSYCVQSVLPIKVLCYEHFCVKDSNSGKCSLFVLDV